MICKHLNMNQPEIAEAKEFEIDPKTREDAQQEQESKNLARHRSRGNFLEEKTSMQFVHPQ
jgi:hypothetical protein